MTDAASFTARLQADGFQEILTREIKPDLAAPGHSHPYDARGLTLAGRFTVASAGGTQDCGPGEWFELAAGIPHTETTGPEGATVLIGRRHKG